MTFADLCKEMMETSRERLKTPLTGAFIWAFIVYNWELILYLIFSETTIEYRIYYIGSEYYSPGRFWYPVLIALIYVLIVPVFTVLIEMLMKIVSNQKITNQYVSKLHKVNQMKKIAGAERELKNEQTGNKEIEDFMRKVSQLELEKEQLKNEHEVKVREFNSKVEDLVNNNGILVEKVATSNKEFIKFMSENNLLLKILSRIGIGGINTLRLIEEGKNEKIMHMDKVRQATYKNLGLIKEVNSHKILLTELGESVMNKFEGMDVEHFKMTNSEKTT